MVIYKVNQKEFINTVFRVGASKEGFQRHKFINGRYATDDKDVIKFLDDKNWCDRVTQNINTKKMEERK